MNQNLDLRRELRRMTAEAFRRDEPSSSPALEPRAGDLYHFETCPEPGLEWLVLDDETAAGKCLVVPADAMSWIGSSDVAVADETVAGPLSLRCAHHLWLDREVLSGLRRTSAIGTGDLERARARRQQLLAKNLEATPEERETDADPEYLDWCRVLESARDAVAEAYGGRHDEAPPEADKAVPAKLLRFEKPDRSRLARRALPLAASIVAVLTSGFFVGRFFERQRHQEELAALQQQYEEQLAEVNQPEVVPWLIAPIEPERDERYRLAVPDGARSIALILDAEEGDRVEIRDLGSKLIWSATVGEPGNDLGALVRWPADLTPLADYQVVLLRDGKTQIRFLLRLESP